MLEFLENRGDTFGVNVGHHFFPDAYATVRPLMRCLRKQTIRKELELVFVVPVGTMNFLEKVETGDFGAVKRIEIRDMKRSAHARR